jgi:rod shape determining protein RodA
MNGIGRMEGVGSRRPTSLSFRRGLAVDMKLLVAVVAIVTAGLVNLYSATSVYADTATRARLADIYVSQVYWMVVGGLLAILVAAIDYRHYERFAGVLYAGGILSLGLVFILGSDIRGSSRWIQLGSFTFQPSEFMKVLLVMMVARHVHNDNKTEPRTLVDLAIPGLLITVPVGLVMIQPDLGTGLIMSLSSATILLMTRIRRRTLLAIVAGAGTAIPLAWTYAMKQYQKDRITSFLDPEHDKTGIGWHALQSQTAIGNGQLVGEGFMQGTQNQFGFLPDQFSDFPFAVFAEDWGFLGCLVLIGLYCFVCVYAIHVASQAKDRFGAALATGIGALIFWHAVFNIGMAIGVLPVVGVTLPLFSYGGSSVVTTMIGLGLLMNVSMRR